MTCGGVTLWGVGMSVWGYLIEHQACVRKDCVCVEERRQNNRETEKGRRWIESGVDVMQHQAAITKVLCSRSAFAAQLIEFPNVHLGCFNSMNIHFVIPLYLFFPR